MGFKDWPQWALVNDEAGTVPISLRMYCTVYSCLLIIILVYCWSIYLH